MILTKYLQVAMLISLPHCSTRLASRNTSGTDRDQAVFLCAKHLNSAFHYVGLGGAAERLAGARTGMPTLSSPAPMIGIMAVGFITLRDTIMKNKLTKGNYAQNSAKSSQTKQSRFNLIKRTPEGKRVICQDLTFVQAVALVAEIPAAIVKFSRMEAVQ
jgi:hypothetical protein